MVKDHKPSPLGSNLLFTSPRDQLVEAGDQIFFLAGDGAGRVSLWKSDGTEAGTVLVNDIQPGIGSSNPVYLVSFAGKLFFRANDGSSGTELWRSDGTEDGTALVRDIAHVSIASFPRSFANLNGL